MQRWLERIPGLATGPLWRRWLAAAGYVLAASLVYTAYAGTPSPEPTPVPPVSSQPVVESQPAPAPPPAVQPVPPVPVQPAADQNGAPSIYGRWHGETPMASPIGTVTAIIEIVFVPNGNYSALSTSTYPGGTPVYVTGRFAVDAAQRRITVSDVKSDPQSDLRYILYQYTFVDANTLRLQDLGCLQYAPQQCGPITYARVQ